VELVLVGLLAFANGANDNGKGVATLVGSGMAKPRLALLWAAITTAVGVAASFWLAGRLLSAFGAPAFLPAEALNGPVALAALLGACGWVLLATRCGLPVSTTHAIVGGLAGAGLAAVGPAALEWQSLGRVFLLPLALGPILSLGLTALLAGRMPYLTRRYGDLCACIAPGRSASPGPATAAAAAVTSRFVVSDRESCRKGGAVVLAAATPMVQGIHWIVSGLIGIARGGNDGPKIAALGLVALGGREATGGLLLLVALLMGAGGVLAGRRVLETMAGRIAPLPAAPAAAAGGVTALMVGLASWGGFPLSTTHVSTGSVVGVGLATGRDLVRWRKVSEILCAWLITLPTAALLAAAARYLLS
jgi:inorganic phosphate transporter, PiT family